MPAKVRSTLYEQHEAPAEGLIGAIRNGELHVIQPRPSGPGTLASALGRELFGPFHGVRGGPGGWLIIAEPEPHFLRDTEVDVPDLDGWRRTRMPRVPDRTQVRGGPGLGLRGPVRIHREQGPRDHDADLRPYGVADARLIDPGSRILDAYVPEDGSLRKIGHNAGNTEVSVRPFQAGAIDPSVLWEKATTMTTSRRAGFRACESRYSQHRDRIFIWCQQ